MRKTQNYRPESRAVMALHDAREHAKKNEDALADIGYAEARLKATNAINYYRSVEMRPEMVRRLEVFKEKVIKETAKYRKDKYRK